MQQKSRLFYREDPLAHLPRKRPQKFPKHQMIYDMQPSPYLYAVASGRVLVTAVTEGGREIVSRIVGAGGLFGAPVRSGVRAESAMALELVHLMAWPQKEVARQIEEEPRLGLALLQELVLRGLELQDRIETIAIYGTSQRVMLSFVQLAAALGKVTPDGAVRIGPLPQHIIASYVGTSREIVSSQMNRLRRLGMLQYSRKFIDIHVKAMQKALDDEASVGSPVDTADEQGPTMAVAHP